MVGIISCVESIPGVEVAPEYVVGHAHPWKDQARRPDHIIHFSWYLASEEAAVGKTMLCRDILWREIEIDVLEDVVADDTGTVWSGKIRKVLYFLVSGRGGHVVNGLFETLSY